MSNKPTHTPGPWALCHGNSNLPEKDADESRNIGIYAYGDVGRGGSWVAVIEGDVFPVDEMEANARLIAAAPDLLAVAEAWANCGFFAGSSPVENSNDPIEALLFKTRAAISKAEGGGDE